MLQCGIDGYMAGKQPDSLTTTNTESTPGDASLPLSNYTETKNKKNSVTQYDSEDEETAEERQKRIAKENEENHIAWETRLSESQYTQKGKHAIDAGLVKVLFLDHLHITKQAGSLTMNNLMQCFDRMCWTAGIRLIRAGLACA